MQAVLGVLCIIGALSSSSSSSAAFECGDLTTIPAPWVGDDFCDCADGSDELATSACSHIVAATSPYQCRTFIDGLVGLTQSTLRSVLASRVGDGVCDCCDGSDEPAAAKCPDRCAALRVELEVQLAARRATLKRGLAARAAALAEVSLLRQTWRHGIELAQKHLDAAVEAERLAKVTRDAAVAEESALKRQRARFEVAAWDDPYDDEEEDESAAEEEESVSCDDVVKECGMHLLSWRKRHCVRPGEEEAAAATAAAAAAAAEREREDSERSGDAAPAADDDAEEERERERDEVDAVAESEVAAAAAAGAAVEGERDADLATVEVELGGKQREIPRAEAEDLLAAAEEQAKEQAKEQAAPPTLVGSASQAELERDATARCAGEDFGASTLPACICDVGATYFPTPRHLLYAALDDELPHTRGWLDVIGFLFSPTRVALYPARLLMRLLLGNVEADAQLYRFVVEEVVDVPTAWGAARVWEAVPALWRYLFQSSKLRAWEYPPATAARRVLDDAVAARTHATRELSDATQRLTGDFGDNDICAPLERVCFDLRHQQYTYTVCPFHNATQDSTLLGKWTGSGASGGAGEWRIVTAEDKLESFGGNVAAFGLHHRFWYMGNGRHCHQGKDRSMSIFLTCDETESLKFVDEPEACVYRAVLGAPAFCSDSNVFA